MFEVYIRIDKKNNIIAIGGGEYLDKIKDIENWIFVEEGKEERYRHPFSMYLDKPLLNTEHMLFNYAYIDGKIIEKDLTEEIERVKHRRALELEKQELESWLKSNDYIGIKIATGRATKEEYAEIIEEMSVKADRINEIDAELSKL